MDRIVEQCAPEPMRAHCSTLVQCMAHLPGWGEKNFQVCVCVRVRVCVCEHVHVRAGGQAARAGAGVCVCVRAGVFACVVGFGLVGSGDACMRACWCVCGRVRMCVHACAERAER